MASTAEVKMGDVAAALEGTSDKSGAPVVVANKGAERKMAWGTPNPVSKLLFAYVSPLIGIGQIRRLEPEVRRCKLTLGLKAPGFIL